MTNYTTTLRALLQAGEFDYEQLYDHMSALLDRLEKLEAVTQSIVNCNDYDSVGHLKEAALAALDTNLPQPTDTDKNVSGGAE